MRHSPIAKAVLVLVSLLVAVVVLNGVLGASEGEGGSDGVPVPVIHRGQGDSCIDDTEFMRRYHMIVLGRHKHDGSPMEIIRGRTYSIYDCIVCHTVMGPDDSPLTVESPEHFCRSCHDYAAVKIGCFECHVDYIADEE